MIKRFLGDFKKYYRYSIKAAKVSLKAEVAGSYLNWIWWVLNPICVMLIYAFIFGVLFNAKEEYFPIFIFIGLTLWTFHNKTVTYSVSAIKRNMGIVSKVYLPKFILIITQMMINGFKMLISIAIIIIMMIVMQVPFSWANFFFIPIILIMMVWTFGVSLLFMHWGVYVRDLNNIIMIVFRFLFYFTGIFFDVLKRFPEPYNYWVSKLNPMACFMISARKALLEGHVFYFKTLLIWLLVGIVISVFGIWLIYKKENNYVKVI